MKKSQLSKIISEAFNLQLLNYKIKKKSARLWSLNESNCVSFDVDNYAKKYVKVLLDDIENKNGFDVKFSIGNNNFWKINKKNSIVITKPNNDFYSSISIVLSIYDFNSIEDAKTCCDILNFGGEYYPDKNEIIIIGYSINGKINVNFIEWYLEHEFLHLFQKNKSENINIKRIYNISNYILNNSIEFNENDIKVSWLFYWLNKKEINANAQMLYIQIKNFKNYNKTGIYNEYITIKNYLYDVKNDKDYFKKCSEKEFKSLDYKKTIEFFQNYLNYAIGKFGHVIIQVKNEEILKETNFKPLKLNL